LDKDAIIFVAGGDTLIGSAIMRELGRLGFSNRVSDTPGALNLTNAASVQRFFVEHKPAYIFLAAGKSGGIEANRRYPASLMLDNLIVESHVIRAAHEHGVKKLLYLASSCCYPRICPQPMQVNSLLTGALEPTNEAYAVAKLAGIKLCQAFRQQYSDNFIVGIPANAFGPGDEFSPTDSHVIAALITRMHQAKLEGSPSVEIWGTGSPRREFVFGEDLANACVFVMQHYDGAQPINLGGGTDVSIKELASQIAEIVGYRGELRFDPTKPDGMPLKALDSAPLLALGWAAATPFRTALEATYQDYLQIQLEFHAR